MDAVGAYEAKTHLAQLLDRVEKGERITIMRHGVPVALLQPVEPKKQLPANDVIEQIRQFRTGKRLDKLSLEQMIQEGRD